MRVQGMTGSRNQPKAEITQEIIMFFQSGRHFELFCEGIGVSADVFLNELGLRTEEEEE
jgi:hypothetical protein